jgi:geranylgeranyl diphosphate synthase type II
MTVSAEALLAAHSDALHRHFEALLLRYPSAPPRLIEAIAYSIHAGGKRLRPALILESSRAAGGDKAAMQHAMAAAAAMELIHTFSLVHDDLPAMDNDDLRRGRPTNHKVYGEAMAILAGDAMTTMAFEVLAMDVPAPLSASLIRELAASSGPAGMIGGQVLDMEGENQSLALEQLQRLHRMKTGALITCSCRLGGLCAGAGRDAVEALGEYGALLGLAFQIVDDILDETSTAEAMGKAVKKDAAKGKNTYPVLLGLDGSREAARAAAARALAALAPLGDSAESLRQLARFVIDRSH